MLLEALMTARDLGRLHDVAAVLVRHGFGDLLRRLGILAALRRAGRVLHWNAASRATGKPTAQHVREALEELGPTFVKVGQLLADRPDLLPPEWVEELVLLQENAQPVPFSDLLPQLADDLGGEPEVVFAEFEPVPVAAASIAQVHRARLRSGEPVAVKVRRPGVREVVEADLRLLTRLADLADRELPELRRYRPRQVVRQLASSLRAEIDFRTEARNAERLRAILLRHEGVAVPVVYEQFTTASLVVLELFEGRSIGDWVRSPQRDLAQGKRLAALGADAVMDMVLERGFFHADPHPGNVFLLDDGRLGFLDFGMVGRLSESRRLELFELLDAAFEGQEQRVVDVLLDWSPDGQADLELLTQDCAGFIDRYRHLPLQQLDVAAALTDIASLLRDNDLTMPADIAMLIKVLITLDNVGRLLDPGFVTAAHLEPYVRRAVRRRRSPFRLMRRGILDSRALLLALPRYGRSLGRHLRRGRLGLDLHVRQLDDFSVRLDQSINRLTVGMITAALIVGTAIAMAASGGPTALGVPLLGLLGFVTSSLGGLWLLWLIARSTKR